MKQIGNLAIVCTQRPGVLLQILDGKAAVHVGQGTNRKSFAVDWDNEEEISKLIRELNFGELSEKEVRYDTKH